jgi:hypothetical protein
MPQCKTSCGYSIPRKLPSERKIPEERKTKEKLSQ